MIKKSLVRSFWGIDVKTFKKNFKVIRMSRFLRFNVRFLVCRSMQIVQTQREEL